MRMFVAVVGGVLAWLMVVAAALFAMGDDRRAAALSLIAAGLLAGLGVFAGLTSLRGSSNRPIRGTIGALGSVIAAGAGLVAVFFALSFHW